MLSGINNHISIVNGYPKGISKGQKSDPKTPDVPVVESVDALVTISDQAKELQKQESEKVSALSEENELSEEDKRKVEQLKKIDRETKAHEQAHLAAGAGLVQGGASFTYQRGPDGRMYAVGGEVSIDTSPENDPDATIRKMQQVKRAAMAPSNPSGQDRSVAAQATQTEAAARIEKTKQNQEESEKNKHEDTNSSTQNQTTPYENSPHHSVEKGLAVDLAI